MKSMCIFLFQTYKPQPNFHICGIFKAAKTQYRKVLYDMYITQNLGRFQTGKNGMML